MGHRSREGWSAGAEGTDRSTSCATVYNAGNTICRNLLPLDTRSGPRAPMESAFSIVPNTALAFAVRLSSFRQMREATTPASSSPLLARVVHSRVYATRALAFAYIRLDLLSLFPFSLGKISPTDESPSIKPVVAAVRSFSHGEFYLLVISKYATRTNIAMFNPD